MARGRTRRSSLALLAGLSLLAQLTLSMPAAVAAVDDTASIAGVWTATPRDEDTTNPGIKTVPRDGAGGVAEFQYNHDLGVSGGASGSWDFHTTAAQSGTVNLDFLFTGLHAWFQVTVGLQAYVERDGVVTTVETLVADGPVNCCTQPSNGFTYPGDTALVVEVGDEFGFHITG